jgi:hemerythrin-like domain-containing protein
VAKRHPSLVLLSQDHHHGLALAIRLKQGEKALLNGGWTHDRQEQSARVRQFYQDELSTHFLLEEEILFPFLLRFLPTSSTLIRSLIAQHREMEGLIHATLDPGTSTLDSVLSSLGDVLERHIRLEEGELFPQFEKSVSQEAADHLGKELKSREEAIKQSRTHVLRAT